MLQSNCHPWSAGSSKVLDSTANQSAHAVVVPRHAVLVHVNVIRQEVRRIAAVQSSTDVESVYASTADWSDGSYQSLLWLLWPRQELGDTHRTLAGVCNVTNKLENFSGNQLRHCHPIILSNVKDDNRRMVSTHGWQMVLDTLSDTLLGHRVIHPGRRMLPGCPTFPDGQWSGDWPAYSLRRRTYEWPSRTTFTGPPAACAWPPWAII